MEQTKLGLLVSCLAILLTALSTAADPQTNLLNVGCSQYNATNHASFFANLNATFSNLSTQIAAGGGFATAQLVRSANPVYALFQCRGYLSTADCTTCLGVAVAKIRGCAAANGARVIYDGCFLRYESAAFFDQSTLPGNVGVCGNKTDAAAGFAAEAVGLLADLSEVVPRVKRYFAAAVRGGVYAVGQCAETVAEDGCRQCLAVAYENVKGCPPDGEGRAVDAGCFMRYSDQAFFGANQTVDLTAYLVSGDSSKKVAIIGGVAGGVGVLILGFLVFFWIRRSRKPQNTRKGDKGGTLIWKQKFDIIVGMARGLAYLHHEFHVCIIHRDIKSSNVLLDDDFQPRIADFGLAKLLPGDQSHLSTRFAGTLGYTAPEYALHGKLSVKVDTYSYGVVVLEIISGRKSNDISLEPISQYLLEWAWDLYENGKVLDLVDKTINPSEYDPEEMKKIIEIALLCTQSAVASRPTMSEVVILLLSKSGNVVPPTRPTFIDAGKKVRGDASSSSGTETSSASHATVSITQISAR